MSAHPRYHGMQCTGELQKIADLVPLVTEGRSGDEPVAVARMITGTDV